MNHHKSHLHSRLTSSSSLPSPPLPTSSSPSCPASSPASAPPPDYCASLLKLRAARAFKFRNFPPLSPQESSTLSFSDSTSSNPFHRAQLHEPRHVSASSSPSFLGNNGEFSSSSCMSTDGNRLLINRGNTRDPLIPVLPMMVRSPDAFQCPVQGKAKHKLDEGDRASEDSKRLKRTLEDLERELLGDDPDIATSSVFSDVATSSVLKMEIHEVTEPVPERDWTDVIEDLLTGESASPTTTMDHSSTVTSITCNTSRLQNVPTSPVNSHPRDHLIACASAINNEDYTSARTALSSLEQFVSIYGDPMQRLGAYMAEGLAGRMELIKDGHSNRLSKVMKEPAPMELLRSMQVLYQWCAHFKFGYMVANATIAEAFRNERFIHIVDFDIGQGNQWHTLIGAFAQRHGGPPPPHVCITGMADPRSPTSLVGVQRRLQEVARRAGVPFEFKSLQMDAAHIDTSMIQRKTGEALAINFAYHLHKMADESVSISNPRDSLLQKVKSMQPKVVTLVEHDANTNTAPFYARFSEVLDYFNAIFESLDAVLPRDSRERVNAEKLCLARDIANIVACEGVERTQRYELAGKWRARMKMAGFRNMPPSPYIMKTIKELLLQYSPNYKLREEGGVVHLAWLERELVAASAWK